MENPDLLPIVYPVIVAVRVEEIVQAVQSAVTKLIMEENRGRMDIKESGDVKMKNKVARAYGVLMYSYQLDAVEAMDALSLIKMGLDVGWVEGADQNMVNNVLFNTRRAHLMHGFQEEPSSEEAFTKRAGYVKKALSGLAMAI